jgi:hypothetical protein
MNWLDKDLAPGKIVVQESDWNALKTRDRALNEAIVLLQHAAYYSVTNKCELLGRPQDVQEFLNRMATPQTETSAQRPGVKNE